MQMKKPIIVSIECALEGLGFIFCELLFDLLKENKIPVQFYMLPTSLDLDNYFSFAATPEEKQGNYKTYFFCERLMRQIKDIIRNKREFIFYDKPPIVNTQVILCPNYIDYLKLNPDYPGSRMYQFTETLLETIGYGDVLPNLTFVLDTSNWLYKEEIIKLGYNRKRLRNETEIRDFVKNYSVICDSDKSIQEKPLTEKNKKYLNYFIKKEEYLKNFKSYDKNFFCRTSIYKADKEYLSLIKQIYNEIINYE